MVHFMNNATHSEVKLHDFIPALDLTACHFRLQRLWFVLMEPSAWTVTLR